MPTTTITQLSSGDSLQDTDLFPIDRGANTLSMTAGALITYINALPRTGGILTGDLDIQPSSDQKGVFSAGAMLLGQNNDSAYFGRTAVTENQLTLVDSTVGQTWFTSGTTAQYFTSAMSSNGRVHIALVTGGSIYVSTDFGKTWSERNVDAGPQNYTGAAMSVDGKNQTVVTTGGLIYTSEDYGQTWNSRHTIGNYYSVSMTSDGAIQVVVETGGSVYSSYDFGATWAVVSEPNTQNSVTDNFYFDIAISSNACFQTIVSYGDIDNNPVGYLYVSKDYGQNWELKRTDLTVPYMSVAMSSDGKYQTAATFGANLVVSVDYGTTWQEIILGGGPKYFASVAMCSTGKIQIAASQDEGLYISTNHGVDWTLYSSALMIYDIAISSDGKVISTPVWEDQMYVSYTDSVVQGNLNGVNSIQNGNVAVFDVSLDADNPAYIFVGGQIRQVLLGDRDSAGSGFRTLRVAN